MKIRWREHELIFVTTLVAAQVIMEVWNFYNPASRPTGIDYAAAFSANDYSFLYWKNVLLPQIELPVLMYLIYLSVNLLIIPAIKRITFKDVERLLTVKIVIPVIAIAATAFLLAIGMNTISYYAKPHLVNYAGYQLLALAGYNDQPLANIFFGFGRATGLILILVTLAGVRELIIGVLGRPGAKREYRVMIVNNATPLLFIYLLIPVFINPLHNNFMDYLAWVTPVLLLYIYLTFWLFPMKEQYTWLQPPLLIRLLVATMAWSLLSAFLFSGSQKLLQFIVYWLFLLFVITPLCWLLYQQRKDKILQLKGMETALARSATDLQFLRSQINPHFLFNALNTLYGTALKERSEQTATGIQLLGDMMRFMLQENQLDYIPMKKELQYLENYIALQKLRTPASEGIRITDNFDEVKCNRAIAPMLLIPFVENAFKHGISLEEKSWIDIRLECREESVFFQVKNSVHKKQATDTEKDKSGIGLKNVTERLKLLYPGKHELVIQENENEFVAKLLLK